MDEVMSPPSPERPGDGPLCAHNEPTVLRELNGRRFFVCRHFPSHHCSKWCPADMCLLPPRPLAPLATGRSLSEQPGCSAAAAAAVSAQGEEEEPASPPSTLGGDAGDSKTPSQQLSTPAVPAAPSKTSSLDSSQRRAQNAAAQRSLVPVFNAFRPAAIRAAQLGGNFVTRRPDSRLLASMRHRASVSPSAAAAGSGGSGPAARKRARGPAAEQQAQAAQRPRHPLQELALPGGGTNDATFSPAPTHAPATSALLSPGSWPSRRRSTNGVTPIPLGSSAAPAGSWLRSAARPPQ